jgi:anti-sigma regulatory factor (Ser/Thr protein kinase)
MEPLDASAGDYIEVTPLVVLSQTFPARPSAIPEIRDFVKRCLSQSPLNDEDARAINISVSQALLDAAGPTGSIQVSFRIFPDHAEVDVLRSGPAPGLEALASTLGMTETPGTPSAVGSGSTLSFADWMSAALRREGLTMEAAARQLGVSVKTVSRWVGGATEPRLRDLRRIRDVFGEVPLR